MKTIISLSMCLFIVLLSVGCSLVKLQDDPGSGVIDQTDTSLSAGSRESSVNLNQLELQEPASLLQDNLVETKLDYKPQVPGYQLESDLANVINVNDFYLNDQDKAMLAANGFLIKKGAGNEFHEIYETNMYLTMPSFITVDSLLHAYHLFYAYLQKNIERGQLAETLDSMAMQLLESSQAQEKLLQGTEFESAVQRNIAFCEVASSLLGGRPAESQLAKEELALINAAEGVAKSPIFSTADNPYLQDYSQFKPRGYYTEDEGLGQYFKAMSWFGQMNFSQKDSDLNKSALLLTLALKDGAIEEWNKVYQATSFFSGESDDLNYYDYLAVAEAVYGEEVAAQDLAGKTDKFTSFENTIKKLKGPKINSIVLGDPDQVKDKEAASKGFRLMGQRFTLDASIFNQLIYQQVGENSQGEQRLLPDALDVPAALGSESALNILTEAGETDYAGYSDQMSGLREKLAGAESDIWTNSMYSAWLNSLRPLLIPKGEGYPTFMQQESWLHKNLNSFLGSYTELKHDSILYAKQAMAEMGGVLPKPDDRGYVEAEPDVFARLSGLALATAQGLEELGLINQADAELARLLAEIADKLKIIAIKQLENELPTDEEFDFIRSYGGQLEHFWSKTVAQPEEFGYKNVDSSLVADVATGGDQCLELAIGKPDMIIVPVYLDGQIRLTRGSIFSFYQFAQPVANRLTDEEWREILRDRPDDYSRPAWLEEYISE